MCCIGWRAGDFRGCKDGCSRTGKMTVAESLKYGCLLIALGAFLLIASVVSVGSVQNFGGIFGFCFILGGCLMIGLGLIDRMVGK